MKRIMSAMFVVAMGFTMISGCCADAKRCTESCAAAMDKAASIEASCSSSAKAAEAAAMKAEAAARRAEAAADKAESIFMKHMKK